MLPYEVDRELSLTANVLAELPAPKRGSLLSLIITGLSTGAKVNVYSRLLAQTVNIVNITSNSAGKCVITLETELMAKVGDRITVASSPTAGYNTSHKITARRQSDGLALTTDQNFTAHAVGGTAATNFSASLYRVIPEQTAASNLISWAGDESFINGDPRYLYDGAIRPRLWIAADATATVRVVANFRLPETTT